MKKISNIKYQISNIKRGFTLIELLIVIGIIGILAAIVLVGIDPVDKINNANDTKVQRDINALANATEAYAANHNGCYNLYTAPNCTSTLLTEQNLVDSGDLKVLLKDPSGNLYTNRTNSAGTAGQWTGPLKSKKFVSNPPNTPVWAWCSSSSKAGAVGVGPPVPCP